MDMKKTALCLRKGAIGIGSLALLALAGHADAGLVLTIDTHAETYSLSGVGAEANLPMGDLPFGHSVLFETEGVEGVFGHFGLPEVATIGGYANRFAES